MANEDPTSTIEIETPAASPEASKPTKEQMLSEGLTAPEIEKAEKAGLLATPKKEGEEEAPATPPAAPAPGQGQPPAKPEVPSKASSIPDVELTPEQEKIFLQTFGQGHPTRGLYFRMKNERQARQRIERQAKVEIEELKAKIANLEKGPVRKEDQPDPNKPLTEQRLKEIREEEARAALKEQDAANERSQVLASAQQNQEEFMRNEHGDFDKTVELAIDLVKNASALGLSKAQITKAGNLYRMLQQASAKADTFEVDEYNAAHIAYELGKMHPKYGQVADGTGSPEEDPMPGEENGKLNPEQMKRVDKNAQKGLPSGAISGGNRKIPVADVTAEMLLAMDYKRREAFKRDHPKRYAEIIEG